MTLLNPQQATPAGRVLTLGAATAGASGDTFKASRNVALEVRNGSAASITVTLDVPGNDSYGQPRPDIAVVVAAAAAALIGPFPPDLEDPATGLVKVTYSAVATVTVALIQI